LKKKIYKIFYNLLYPCITHEFTTYHNVIFFQGKKMTVLTAPERSREQQQMDEEEDGYFTCQVSVHHKVRSSSSR
jgi:hypothetical protein